MGGRKYILILVFMAFGTLAKAQLDTYTGADSTSAALYNRADWRQLIISGNRVLDNKVDFPTLRLRLAYAYFMTGDLSAALNQYSQVLKADSYNQTARYYSYLCYRYLNQDVYANRQTAYFDSVSIGKRGNNFGLVSAGLEESYKIADDEDRGNSSYTRFGLSVAVTPKLQVDQSVSFFKQYIYLPFYLPSVLERRHEYEDDQTEYYAGATYALTEHFSAIGAYHYLYTTYRRTFNNSHILLAGLNYNSPYFNLQADAEQGYVIQDKVEQYNLQGMFYPFGNLNLYSISRLSYHHQNESSDFWLFKEAVGFKALRNLWLESSATFGDEENYIDANGLYVYNTYDNTIMKLGETIFYQFNAHATLQINYTLERKQELTEVKEFRQLNVPDNPIYNQYGITLGILWKF